jgi:hypothetical protein
MPMEPMHARNLTLVLDAQPAGKSLREKQLSFAVLHLTFAFELSACPAIAG